MAENKTQPTKESVTAFLNSIKDEQQRKDSKQLVKLMQEWTGQKPQMWGNGMVGYGMYHYKSERSRQEGDWPLTAFAPRSQNLTVYNMSGFGKYAPLLKKLGKHKTGGSCLYIRKLEDVDQGALKELVQASYENMKKVHGANVLKG
jgi:hypothetical protein